MLDAKAVESRDFVQVARAQCVGQPVPGERHHSQQKSEDILVA